MALSIKIRKPEDKIVMQRPFIVLHGLPGVGKTTLSFTVNQILHIDSDRGIHRAVQEDRVPSIEIDSYGTLRKDIFSSDFVTYIKDNGFRAVSLDTIGTLLEDYMTPWLISQNNRNGNNSGGLSVSGWGALSTEFGLFINRLRSLNLSIIAVCHSKEEGDGNKKKTVLAVKGGSSEIIYRTCDLIGEIYVQGDKRLLNFNPRQSSIGKNVGNLPILTIPNSSSDSFNEFAQVHILDKLEVALNTMSKAQKESLKKIQLMNERISICETFKDLAELNDDIDSYGKSIQLQIMVSYDKKYCELYSIAHFEGIKSVKDFNTALIDMKENLPEGDKGKKIGVWNILKSLAKDNKLEYNSESKKFAKAPTKSKLTSAK